MGAQPGKIGSWSPPFNHDPTGWPDEFKPPICKGKPGENICFNAIHAAYIPLRNKVLVWDDSGGMKTATAFVQRWAVIDPEAETFNNYLLHIPLEWEGDLYCAGHAWTPRGRLFVAGGANRVSTLYWGLKVAFLFDPFDQTQTPGGSWYLQSCTACGGAMKTYRWYPTVTLLGEVGAPLGLRDRMVITGGIERAYLSSPRPLTPDPNDRAANTYEVFVPPKTGNLGHFEAIASQWVWFGPRYDSVPGNPNGDHPLDAYAKIFLLSHLAYGGPPTFKNLSRLFMAGSMTKSASLDHPDKPGDWGPPPPHPQQQSTASRKLFGTALLRPGRQFPDQVIHIGGLDMDTDPGTVLSTVEVIDNRLASPSWATGVVPNLQSPRWGCDSLALPDGSTLVLGGMQNPGQTTAEIRPERYVEGQGWTYMAPEASPRNHHSTAILLASGRVLVAGGDAAPGSAQPRTYDYQVFSPTYLDGNPPRPQWGGWPATMAYDQQYSATYSGVNDVARVVLIAPASVTHTTDMHQRYVELEVVTPPKGKVPATIYFKSPKNSTYAPRGYYMMWLVTPDGIPSVAQWTRLQ